VGVVSKQTSKNVGRKKNGRICWWQAGSLKIDCLRYCSKMKEKTIGPSWQHYRYIGAL